MTHYLLSYYLDYWLYGDFFGTSNYLHMSKLFDYKCILKLIAS